MRKFHPHPALWATASLAVGLFVGCGGSASPAVSGHAAETAASASPDAAIVFRSDVVRLDDQRVSRVNVAVPEADVVASETDGVLAAPQTGKVARFSLQGDASSMAAIRPEGVFVSGNRAYKAHSVVRGSEGVEIEASEPPLEEVVESLNLVGDIPLSEKHLQTKTLPSSVQVNSVSSTLRASAGENMGPVQIEDTGSALVFSLNNFVIVDLDGNRSTTYDQILANGTLTLDKPTISFNVKWKFLQPPTAKLNFHTGESAHLSVSTPAFSFNKTYEVPIAGFQVPVPGTVGAVTIGGKINLILSASGQIQASVVFDQFASVDAGLVGEGFPWKVKPYSTVNSGFSVVPSITGSLSLGAYVSPRLSLLVLQYDLAGVYAKLGIEASATGVVSPTSQCVTIGVNGKVGVNGYFKIPFYSTDKEIYSHTWPIYNHQFCND